MNTRAEIDVDLGTNEGGYGMEFLTLPRSPS